MPRGRTGSAAQPAGWKAAFEMTSSFGRTAAEAAEVLSEANIDASIGDPDAFIAGFR